MEKTKKERLWSTKDLLRKNLIFGLIVLALLCNVIINPSWYTLMIALVIALPLLLTISISVFQNPYGYRTKYGTTVIFKIGWVDKKEIEDRIEAILDRWSAVLHYEGTDKMLDSLSEITIKFHPYDNFGAPLVGRTIELDYFSDTKWREMRHEICQRIAARLFPSLSYAYRTNIMRRYHII